MDFAKVVKNNNYQNLTRTENDAVALKTTESALLDLFATVGALRQKNYYEIANAFDNAFAENRLFATKLMFYARNIRGGLGERDTFRAMLHRLAETNPHIVLKNIELIPHFGRYDDLYALIDTPVEEAMWKFISNTIFSDISAMREKQAVTLCAKWLKSVNTSSAESRALGKRTAKALGMNEKEYRKTLSALRRYIDVVEQKMSANMWDEIIYKQVPSGAMKNYHKAFWKHDANGFSTYIARVEKGEEEIKSGTLYPYDILMKADIRVGWSQLDMNHDRVLEAQWRALPNYIEGENNVLVMADTSGSMSGQPIATAIGLAIYFAERNKGVYKDLFLTFSKNPRFVELEGNTLAEKVSKIKAEVANTNLEKAFQLILDVALRNNISAEEMPKSLIIITDMHFDRATRDGNMVDTFYQKMRTKFSNSGYTIPTIIFWNVAQRANAFQVNKDEPNIMLVSGQSTSTFKHILNNIGKTPYESMLEVLSSPEYDCVVV